MYPLPSQWCTPSPRQASERKAQGNLMVRGLTDIVSEADMRGTVGSETLATLLVVVPKHGTKVVCPLPSQWCDPSDRMLPWTRVS